METHLLTSIHINLLKWYELHGRKDLPWRNTADPYAIWVSEIMLQQTQVKTVLERYYGPFLDRFPSIEALAEAKLEDVLKAWEGLGYYNRAVNLYKAVRRIKEQGIRDKRELPNEIEELMTLPGIGKNTAHAIAAFAYHQPVPVLEANVKRIIARVFALRQPTEKELWEKAEALLDRENPFDYNQAMMDIGALVCIKSTPDCNACPLAVGCRGKDNPESYPAKKLKRKTPVRKKDIVVFECAGQYLIKQRKSRFLNGLYGFHEVEQGKAAVAHGKKLERLGHVKQAYSHFTLDAQVYRVQRTKSPGKWRTLAEITALPLSRADQKVVLLLREAR